MSTKTAVVEVILITIDDMNAHLREGERLDRSASAVLFGRDGRLDSLGLVTFIVNLEQHIEERFGTCVTLADERAMSQKRSPFATVDSLADYVALLLDEISSPA